MEENRPPVEEIKRLFLNDGRTRFEYIKFIFTPAQLQDEKPFVLLDQVYYQLGLTKEDIKTKSFHQWLKRYRQRKPHGQARRPDVAESQKVVPAVSPAKPENKGVIKDDFKFTDPSTLKKKDDIILEYVQPIKKDT